MNEQPPSVFIRHPYLCDAITLLVVSVVVGVIAAIITSS